MGRLTRAKLFNVVRSHMQWDDAKTEKWFRCRNMNLGGVCPDDLIRRGRIDRLRLWIEATTGVEIQTKEGPDAEATETSPDERGA